MPDLVSTHAAALLDLRRRAEQGALFAVLDACDEPRVPELARQLGEAAAVSLYRGRADEDLWAIAPYLVRVDPAVLEWIAQTLWTDPWGIFALGAASLKDLRTHFRRFLVVDAPDGDQWYFRFYDPRVLSRFLPTCDAPQLTELFGPLEALGWTDLATYGVTLARKAWEDQAPGPERPRIVIRRR